MEYRKHKRISLKAHPDYRERWVQDRIEEDPSILGLGELELRESERRQPSGGRLDILLQDPESNERYEVEIQLGATDETHIIRTIEYWDIERKRYPQYDHTAVIVAEEVTGRFLNVISLFNGTIPLIAIKMEAVQVEEYLALIFVRVLDAIILGTEGGNTPPIVDREYWVSRATIETVTMVDRVHNMIRCLEKSSGFDPKITELNYNKFYIGLYEDGRPCNFVTFTPRKASLIVGFRLDRSDEVDSLIEKSGLSTLERTRKKYRIRLKESDLKDHKKVLNNLVSRAYNEWTS